VFICAQEGRGEKMEIFIVAFVLNEFLGADDQGEEANFFIDI